MYHKERSTLMAKWLVVMVIALMASVLGAAGDTPEALTVGCIDVGPVADDGWSYAHDFSIPVTAELDENAREVIEVGDLGCWPPGKAFYICFGQTPMSRSGEIRPASAGNTVGKINGDASRFKQVMRERQVLLEPGTP
jgi:hypothetical protein